MLDYYEEKIGDKVLLSIECDSTSLGNGSTMKNVLRILRDKNPDFLSLNNEYKKIFLEKETKLIKEVADALQKINRIKLCDECSFLMDEMEKNPIKTYFLINEKVHDEKCAECRTNLIFLKDVLGKTDLIRQSVKLGYSNEIYHKLFNPITLPAFISSFVEMRVPEKAVLVETYNVSNSKISIYSLPDKSEKMYFVEAPEFTIHSNENKLINDALDRISEEESKIVNPKEARSYFQKIAENILFQHKEELTAETSKRLSDIIARYSAGYGILEILLNDPKIQDVYVDSPGGSCIYLFHDDYEECITNITLTNFDLEKLSARLRAISGRPFDESKPVLHTELMDLGVRVCGVCEPATFSGIGFAFRKHKQTPWTLVQFIKAGMIDSTTAGLLSFLVDSHKSILTTGSRSSGKTSLLTALLAESSPNYRVVVIEDTPELPIEKLKEEGYKVQHLRTQPSLGTETEGGYELTATDALRTALRLGESTLILGEVRGAEAKALFEAMRIGAAGNVVMGTIHGSSAYDTWDRIVNDLGVPSTSFKATDIVISLAPIRKGDELKRTRKLMAVTEVKKYWRQDPFHEKGFNDLVVYNPKKNKWEMDVKNSELIKNIAKMKNMTLKEVEENIKCRAKIKELIVKLSEKKPKLLEVKANIRINNEYLKLVNRQGNKRDYDKLYNEIENWLSEYVKHDAV